MNKKYMMSIMHDDERSKVSNEMKLQAWYNKPVEMTGTGWECQAIPLGNGFLGAMVFGGVEKDKIQTNEHTLWSGGPGANPNYNGGVKGNPEEIKKVLQETRELLQKHASNFTTSKAAHIDQATGKLITNNYDYGQDTKKINDNMQKLFGQKENFGSYQTLDDIYITDPLENTNYSNYRRTLDLNEGIVSVTYTQTGINCKREYFISNPGNIMVIRLSADQKGKLSRDISISSVQSNKKIIGDPVENTLTMVGQPPDQTKDGLRFAQQVKVIQEGGSILTVYDMVSVKDADSILILMTAGTNYKQCMDDTYDYFINDDPLAAVQERIQAAATKSYDDLMRVHQADYKALFNAMQLNLCDAPMPDKPTDELLAAYEGCTDHPNTALEDRYFENLYYQFGRYLLISSSRKGSLPANLQGIWADGLNPPWNADYHANINIQMNYWLAEQTNLSECHLPMIDYISSLVPRGREMANIYYCTPKGGTLRGWVTNHENNIWGNTAPGESGASYFPTAAAWMCQDIWEYYQFTQDRDFLLKNYDTLLGTALFWVDNLWSDERDGLLVANPSYSPEHGPYTLDATAEQSVIWEIFNEVIHASKILEKNTPEVREIRNAQSKLAGPKIGLGGQFMEWKDETTQDITGDNGHRHANHLFPLHPGSQIVAGRSQADDAFVEAMKNTLLTRGDGGTGWSKAWKINFWARLRDGNHAEKMLQQLLKESTAQNLFDLHPPFQIDGNFGATAGMTEMLLQSQGDAIELLPALPSNWNKGSVIGLKARGDIEIDMDWNHNTLISATLRPDQDCELKVRGKNLANSTLKNCDGRMVEFTGSDNNTITFDAKAGKIYYLTSIVK